MGRRDRYELQIARLDGRRLLHDPGPITEFFDVDDDDEVRRLCGQHFVPLACAAEQTPVRDDLRDMPFVADYTLQVWHRNQKRKPVLQSRSTHGWNMSESRFDSSI